MASRRKWLGWLGAWLGLLAAAPAPAAPQPDSSAFATPRVPLEALPPAVQEGARQVVGRVTLSARGPAETFTCQPGMYRWLLDHPIEAGRLWRQLGAKVSEVEDRGQGRFGWHDDKGSDVWWTVALRSPGLVVLYAEGKVKAGRLLPAAAVRALVLLTLEEGKDGQGRTTLRHQAHVLLRTDSRALAAAARLLGGTAPRLAEQYLGQLEMFYGGLAWYLHEDPDRAAKMFGRIGLAVPADAPQNGGGSRSP